MRSDRERFDVELALRVWDGDELITERTWTRRLPR
jgi:hypothetical protein